MFPEEFDRGPSSSWAKLFSLAPLEHYLTHSSGRFRIDFGPVFYRGRLNRSVKLLIVGQDPSSDEIIAQRNLVGFSGQRVQKLLEKIGITKSYTIFNTFLFSIKGNMNSAMNRIALETPIMEYRNRLFDKLKSENQLKAIVSFGNGADIAVNNWPGREDIPWFQLHHPSAAESLVLPNWNANLPEIHRAVIPDKASLVDLTPYGSSFTVDDSTSIPRKDLPFSIASWHGTGGQTRTNRNGDKTIEWNAP